MRDLIPTFAILARGLARLFWRVLRAGTLASGAFFLLMVALACTRLPYDAHRRLGTAAGECHDAIPELIIVLGGSGMPSGPELLRLHRAAEAAIEWPLANLLIIHPGDSSVIRAMRAELMLRGVERSRINLINRGDNTRAQVLALAGRQPPTKAAMAIVTAPENMYRTVLAFRRAGYPGALGLPAWDNAMFHRFEYDHRTVGGKAWTPDVSDLPGIRYTFWNYLKLELTCLREYVAIGYYWLNDWI